MVSTDLPWRSAASKNLFISSKVESSMPMTRLMMQRARNDACLSAQSFRAPPRARPAAHELLGLLVLRGHDVRDAQVGEHDGGHLEDVAASACCLTVGS